MKKVEIFAGMLLWGFAPTLHAQGCSNNSLRGVYSFVASGTYSTGPFAAAGQTTYDGDGNASGVIQFATDGSGGASGVLNWTAPYHVNPDCTATKTMTIDLGGGATLTLSFFITAGSDFKELRFIATSPNTAISGTAVKQ